MDQFLLSGLIAIPLMGALLVALLPNSAREFGRWVALACTGWQLLLAVQAVSLFRYGKGAPEGVDSLQGFQLLEHYDWIDLQLGALGHLSIDYLLGIDGISLPLVVLSALILFIGSLASFEIDRQQRGYFALYLLLSATIMGCFLSLDLFLFFLFFEFMLLPMYFLIGIWGGKRREYASIKFFLYTLLGSVAILLVMIGLYTSVIDPAATAVQAGMAKAERYVTPEMIQLVQSDLQQIALSESVQVHTFNMIYMMDARNYIPGALLSLVSGGEIFGMHARLVAFLALMAGFLVKLPAVPFHTWLPDAHVEAPTPISVILAGILLKIGGYGLVRLAFSIFPEGAVYFAWWIALLGVVAIVYGALVALGTHHLKKIIAYSSVSHMGFVLLGLASLTQEGVNGALFQLFSHGIISSMLFLLAGVLYRRTQHLEVGTYRGLAIKMPAYGGWTAVAFFASLGLPGFSGFVAEVMVLLGAFGAPDAQVPLWMPMAATLGIVVGAAYYLWTYQRMFLGPFSVQQPSFAEHLRDLTPLEWATIAPLGLIALGLGLYPQAVLDWQTATVTHFADMVRQTGQAYLSMIGGQ